MKKLINNQFSCSIVQCHVLRGKYLALLLLMFCHLGQILSCLVSIPKASGESVLPEIIILCFRGYRVL